MDSAEKTPVGAVMVVGGGIAGMQASLDLAEQGFKVYLVEAKSAIGGKMAQLDKTFPTNDCAMCTISPKLVEAGRHPNIQVMTDTEVQNVQGTAGNFLVNVLKKPRYINTERCIACGDCSKVCPVIIPDKFNEDLSKRRAAYKLYPQAVPNAFAIEKRGIAPCRDACPGGQRAQGYIALIREGRWQDAMRVIKMDNPFPGICGRICNHRCETACNRGQVDEPINIRALKRFVSDKVYLDPEVAALTPEVPKAEIKYPESRVAIIGAGPCGLTAAQDVIRAGFPVTIFEAMPVAGGMLRLGVPEYRLPAEIIEKEVLEIIDQGIDLRLNTRVDNLDDLFEEGFSAVLIAVGAHEGIRLPIPGANLPGVLINTHFLRDVRLGKYAAGWEDKVGTDGLGKRVLVLGGGNVAIDVARSAVRLGCQVSMACLESYEKMPSHRWEIEAAQAEGIKIFPSRTFEQVLPDETGRVRGVECKLVKDFYFDEVGRLHVEKEIASDHILECDTVIFSVGQRAGLAFIPDDAGVGLTDRKMIAVNPNTFAATRPGVFAAGDSVSGTAFVIEAVASGHRAAEAMIRYLSDERLEPAPKPELPVVKLTSEEIEDRIARGEIHHQPRVPQKELPVEKRLDNFAEVEVGYDDESAQKEAARCLACGICSECMSCTFACGVNAIEHEQVAMEENISVGAVILAPGYEVYKAELSQEFGYGRYPNVITAMQFERLLSASGPTMGHVHRPSDEKLPKRIAFLQCVGSRDQSHDYCSAVCCMYATKEASIAKEHYPDLDIHVFMMDMRAFSKGYWAYFERAQQRYGVQYHRSRVSSLFEDPQTHDLLLRHVSEEELEGGAGIREERFDLVVLSVGMEISEPVRSLGRRLGIELDEYGFCHTVKFNPLETSRTGIYAVGPFREPKDIPESVVEASGAASSAAALLSSSRFTLTTQREYPPERDISGEPVRIGVFVCSCGSNIGGHVDVPVVASIADNLPGVAHSEWNLYTCSQDSIKKITETVKEHNLNRVVVASCTPLTHQPLFQDSIRAAGLNPYLFEMANIRNQCSWVHSNDRAAATEKAEGLVRMSVARAALLEPQHTVEVSVQPAALVIGGGAAGLSAAISLSDQGFPVHLIEKNSELGGNLRFVTAGAAGSRSPQQVLKTLLDTVNDRPNIIVHLNSEVIETSGFLGNFTSKIQTNGSRYEIAHAVSILATGGQEYRGPEYNYGKSPHILTQLDLETLLGNLESLSQEIPTPVQQLPDTMAMIQCVGPAERYCSRICCTVALKNALRIKHLKPETQVFILHKDIRVYGFKERIYEDARRAGIVFLRYDDKHKPEVNLDGELIKKVRAYDSTIGRWLDLHPGILVLSMPVVPQDDVKEVAGKFKVSIDSEKFFLEAHVKLRPVDFATDGVFMAGLAHYPKLLDETMVQAQAAASRAARVLSRTTLTAGGRVAVVDPDKCTGCLTCVRICPFNVPKMRIDLIGVGGIQGAAFIEPAVCQGCGSCAAECPARAIQLMHYTDAQMTAKTGALLQPKTYYLPIERDEVI